MSSDERRLTRDDKENTGLKVSSNTGIRVKNKTTQSRSETETTGLRSVETLQGAGQQKD